MHPKIADFLLSKKSCEKERLNEHTIMNEQLFLILYYPFCSKSVGSSFCHWAQKNFGRWIENLRIWTLTSIHAPQHHRWTIWSLPCGKDRALWTKMLVRMEMLTLWMKTLDCVTRQVCVFSFSSSVLHRRCLSRFICIFTHLPSIPFFHLFFVTTATITISRCHGAPEWHWVSSSRLRGRSYILPDAASAGAT